MLRSREEVDHGRLLDGAPGVHHQHPVRDVGHHTEVMRDQHDSHLQLAPQVVDDAQDASLDRDIERGGRLIREQQTWLARDGERDHGPLRHPA